MNSTGIGYICLAAVIIFGLSNCGTKIDPKEVQAISEACVKLGKEPSIVTRPGEGIRMGCVGQPAASGVH